MKQELWALPFFLVLLGMVGLCVCDMDKMILMTESPPSFQILVHLIKTLSVLTSLCLQSLPFDGGRSLNPSLVW